MLALDHLDELSAHRKEELLLSSSPGGIEMARGWHETNFLPLSLH